MNLTAAVARERFAASRVARLATADAAGVPHVVPVTFAVGAADTLYFAVDHKPKRSTDLRRLRNIAANPRVSLVADHYADDWSALWWSRGDGLARVLADGGEREDALASLSGKYPQYARRPPEGPVVAVDVHRWSGWAYAN
ncbi:TIGR03668 family PPOX class F420-dependent oxidoreductase [Streptomyces sp. V4-01]|uniref:TIGR03668 family PPOX class F420-dependent oxidoreductase n=1 Tax=Actinacidiphila polyblastidii TaxID=3110430 RepID=A0ABU7P9V5_9ACTN|nr:TIGR03668 family PPOX class F420-dependent oxidoreductase [Streptomyces sp. V4-01]